MGAKTKKASESGEVFPRKAVPIVRGQSEEETYLNHAAMTVSSEFAAYRVIHAAEHNCAPPKNIDAPTMLDTLRAQAATINAGDLTEAETMLMNQATALQTLFARLTERAISAEYMSNLEGYMRLALRAQAQCRTTLETISAIKNPPVVYAKQANIAQGHQQVNNGDPSRTRESENAQTQLSGDDDELRQDAGTPRVASADDSSLEALGEIDRTKVTGG